MRDQKRKLTTKLLTGAFLLVNSLQIFAQEHIIQQPNQRLIGLVQEQFTQGEYSLAIQSANEYLSHNRAVLTRSDDIDRAKYFQTISLLKLNRDGAEDSAINFLKTTINPTYHQRTSYALAQYYFKNESLQKAIPYYESVSINNLTNNEIGDSKFELAYCYFNSKQFEKAEPLFASIKELKGKYYIAGNYYYGLLAYNDSKYEEALTSFKRIDDEPEYKNIVPYYIAEIYYFMGDRKKALEEAIRLTRKKEKLYYDNELYLLAAQVLFEEQRYGEALPYFEHYYDQVDKIRKEDLYEMAYSYYRVNEWENAIEKFKPLSNTEDSLGQTAMYLLGDCYLKTNDKISARNAFSYSADMPFYRAQQEASLLLFGKLSFELGYNNDAKRSFTDLIQKFPNSVYVSEAKTLLSDLLFRTNNYADAFEALKNVTETNNDYWKVHQKVTYGYAMQQMQAGNLFLADSLLSLSLFHTVDKSYETAAYFWKGDIAYQRNNPEAALYNLKHFINNADYLNVTNISPEANITNAYFDMGYAAMLIQAYADAQNYFAKARSSASPSSNIAINASAREGDAAFMQKKYSEAENIYDNVIASNSNETDYAILQKAILQGVLGKTTEKIALLQQIINKTPTSKYNNDALYETGVTYLEDEKYQQAIIYFQPLTKNPEARNYATKSWMKIGFAYQELNNDQKAIDAYKHIITDFPACDDRASALAALRSLYIEHNEPDTYVQFLKENNLPAIGTEALDSTYYAAAEAQIANGKWEAAKNSLITYLEKYPNGAFTTKAYYYKAESYYQLKKMDSALINYNTLLNLPWNEFSEASAKRAASICMKNSNYTQAIYYYNILKNSAVNSENLQLAYSGLMQANYDNNLFDQSANYADTILQMSNISPSVMNEVQFFKAKSLQRLNKNDEALSIYEQLQNVDDNDVSNEARYRIAELYFLQDNLKDAEAAANNAIKLNIGGDYWVVKSYLLISDILVKEKDYFNAKATLKSIINNTKNSNLKKEANQKLSIVKSLEKQKSKLKED